MTDLPALSTADPAAPALADGAIPACSWLILPYDTRSFPFAELLKRDVFGSSGSTCCMSTCGGDGVRWAPMKS